MQMLFKQRAFSWFDSYDIYDADGNTLFTVEGQPSWGHSVSYTHLTLPTKRIV